MRYVLALVLSTIVAGCGGSPNPPETPPASTRPAEPPKPPMPAEAEQRTIEWIRKINTAQADYFRKNRRYALAVDELVEAHLLVSEPTKSETGYDFTLRPSAAADKYRLTAAPLDGSDQRKRFFTDNSGTIRFETGKEATPDSPQIPAEKAPR